MRVASHTVICENRVTKVGNPLYLQKNDICLS